jgi:hypothetical protein
MRLRLLAGLCAVSTCGAQIPAGWERHFLRLADEAEVFAQLAQRIIGQESLDQIALRPPPRFQVRGQAPQPRYQKRHIVSEYGYSTFRDDPGNIHEMRQVLTVDGRKVKPPGKLRETLTMGLKTDTDKVKKRMLKEFEGYGLRESATDFGQVLLIFAKRQLENYHFRVHGEQFLGAESAVIFTFTQKSGDTAITVFEGRQMVRHTLRGQLWLRKSDGVPLRITLEAERKEEQQGTIQYRAVVDYQLSAHGLLLPAAVNYAETLGGHMLVENRFRYSDYKRFGADSEIKFTFEEPVSK